MFVSKSVFLHNKFCIIDYSIIINGSYNWTYSAINNEENILILSLENGSKEDMSLPEKFTIQIWVN